MPSVTFSIRRRREPVADKSLHVQPLQREILTIVRQLTPPPCQECSSAEIAAMLQENETSATVRAVGAVMRDLQRAGLVQSRTIRGYHLWQLTPKGRQWLKQK